jgi:hypothetical protein
LGAESVVFQFAIQNTDIKTYRSTNLLVFFLYEWEMWSLILREERRLGLFENWMLIKISGAKRDEATGDWRML